MVWMLFASFILWPTATVAEGSVDDSDARRIMERVDARDDGDRSILDLEMILIDSRDSRRVRRLRSYGRDEGRDEYSIMFFVSPADVASTGFLTYDYADPERDDDQWLYLPALDRIKRLAASDKSGSFMGSDFSYSDMSRRPLDHNAYRLMQETELRGHRVWQIEAVPTTDRERDETGYERSILFVRQDNHVVVRSVHWLAKGSRAKYFDVKSLELIDGIWVPTEMSMTTREGRATIHRTILLVREARFDQDLDDDLFSLRRLEKGL
ncbi:MAG: outer membrane lipoprotein-sorting protein [bacterium]|nr:outer membrane lipoprotein-sorting protein [bacterium]